MRAPVSLSAGSALTPIELEVTYDRCVLCVSATRDFNPLHYDRDVARAAGMPDVFLNTMTYQGLLGRLVLDWAGPEAFLKGLSFRMLQPNIPGDRVLVAGSVRELVERKGDTSVLLDLRVSNQRIGLTTEGTAVVSWEQGRVTA